MARRAAPSPHFVARIRAWFGLSRDELAVYLGVSTGLVQAWETARRAPGPDLLAALLHLLSQVPPPEPSAPALAPAALPPPPMPGTPDAAALQFRQRVCQQNAHRLRQQAALLAQRAHVAARWAQALPTLLRALPPLPGAESPADAAAHTAWQTDWLHRRARPLPAEDVTRWYQLQARAAAYEAEAAALAGSLAGSGVGAPAMQ